MLAPPRIVFLDVSTVDNNDVDLAPLSALGEFEQHRTSTPDQVAGRIVLIGTSAPGLYDLQSTPLETAVPGVQAHAQAIEGVFTGNLLLRPDYAFGLELAFLLAAGMILIGLMRWAAVHWCLVVCLLCLAAVRSKRRDFRCSRR